MSGPEATPSFTALVRRKIEERREGRSEALNALAAAEARLRKRAAPLTDALAAMVARLSQDPMFANAVGRPEVVFKCDNALAGEGYATFDGPAATFEFALDRDGSIRLRTYPTGIAMHALERNYASGYTGSKPLSGTLDGLDEFLARVEDHIAELLADLYLSPAAHLVLGTRKKPGIDGLSTR